MFGQQMDGMSRKSVLWMSDMHAFEVCIVMEQTRGCPQNRVLTTQMFVQLVFLLRMRVDGGMRNLLEQHFGFSKASSQRGMKNMAVSASCAKRGRGHQGKKQGSPKCTDMHGTPDGALSHNSREHQHSIHSAVHQSACLVDSP